MEELQISSSSYTCLISQMIPQQFNKRKSSLTAKLKVTEAVCDKSFVLADLTMEVWEKKKRHFLQDQNCFCHGKLSNSKGLVQLCKDRVWKHRKQECSFAHVQEKDCRRLL